MTNRITNPPAEDIAFEVKVFHADVVELRQVQKSLFFVLPVEHREPNDWYTGENYVECSIKCSVVDERAREEGKPSIDPKWHGFNEVFLEHVRNKEGVSAVCLSTMDEQ